MSRRLWWRPRAQDGGGGVGCGIGVPALAAWLGHHETRTRPAFLQRRIGVVSLLIRPAVTADADPIAAVFLAARRAGMPWLPVLHNDPVTHWWVRTTMLTTCAVWVAEDAGPVVGFAGLCAGVLAHLYVHPAAWGQGIGTRLLDTVRAASTDKLALYVFQRNARARRFYEAQGFTLCALGTGATNEERQPDAYYEWHRLVPLPGGG
jgi:RimJ/RimL family protein N-acetyltransferase